MATTKKQTDEPVDDDFKVKHHTPYDIINMMFRKSKDFEKLSKLTLERNAFVVNRAFAIGHPLQAQCFNKHGISLSDVLKTWRIFAIRVYECQKPAFFYTAGSSKRKEQTAVKDPYAVSADLKTRYCKHYGISYKDFDDAMYFNPKEFYENIKYFEAITATSYAKDQVEEEKIKAKKK